MDTTFGAGPIDYTKYLVPIDALGSYEKGIQSQRMDTVYEQQQAALQKQLALQQQMKEVMAKPFITSADVAPLLAQADPEHFRQFKAAHDMLTETQQQNKLAQASQIMAASQQGAPGKAADIARQQAEAAKNSGDLVGSKQLSDLADHIEADPGNGKTAMAMYLSALGPQGQAIVDSTAKLGEQAHKERMNPLLERHAAATAVTDEANAAIAPEMNQAKMDDIKAQIAQRKADAMMKSNKANGILAPNGKDYMAEYANNGVDVTGLLRTPAQQLQFQKNAQYAEENGTTFDPMAAARALNQEKRTGSSAGSSKVLSQRENIDSALKLLDDMKDTNEKLNLSKIKYVGKAENWISDMKNDPDFVKYRTQRADNLFQLTNALKQNGITDKSLEIEEQANALSLDKEGFKAWYDTQKKALERAQTQKEISFGPRKDLSGVNTSSPSEKSNIAPAGTKAKLPNGTIVISDGKGGWN